MLKPIPDQTILDYVLKARRSDQFTDLMEWLPLWMVYKLSKKRQVTEDDRSEIILKVLEDFPKIWNLSLHYPEESVLGFFVTYGFNLYRNLFRNSIQSQDQLSYLQLWKDESPKEPEFNPTQISEKLIESLGLLPSLTLLILSLKFDLPRTKHAETYLRWKLKGVEIPVEVFYEKVELRSEERRKERSKMIGLVIRYTRFLFENPTSERRGWYLSQKKYWIRRLALANNRSFFSEREIVLFLGLSRKAIRSEIDRGLRSLKSRNQDLLHCA